jgi:hypothetical protein
MAQSSSSCTSVTPSNNAFTAALTGTGISGSPNGFANVSFGLNGTQATINATSLGLGNNITGLTLFQGTPGTLGAIPVQTFTTSANGFNNGRFTATMALDQNTINQIQANPGNFFFVINTTQFPSGAVAGTLMPSRPQVIAGTLNGSSLNGGSTLGTGSFVFTVGPSNGSGNVPLNFDIATFGLGNGFNSLQLLPAGGGSPLVVFGNNSTANNGRLTGSTTISSTLANQLLANPCSFALTLSTPTFPNGAVTGNLSAGNEVFIPVVGSATGVGGTNFQTDLSIFNNSAIGLTDQSANANAFVQFFPTGNGNTTSAVGASSVTALNVAPRGTTTLRDITSSMFNGSINGIGALRIVSAGTVFANARIYNNQISNGRGTLGQFEPGMFRSQALTQGVLVGLGNVSSGSNLANGQSFRTNIGFFNPNDTATTVALELRDSAGNVMSSRTITLGALAHTQMPISGANGLFPDVNADFATSSAFFLSGAPIFTYASIVDNISGDASFVTPSSQTQQ